MSPCHRRFRPCLSFPTDALPLFDLTPPLPHPFRIVPPNGALPLRFAEHKFTLQPSLPGAAVPGSTAGDCDIKARETGLAMGAAYNELEEDAEGNGMTADAASLGVSGYGSLFSQL